MFRARYLIYFHIFAPVYVYFSFDDFPHGIYGNRQINTSDMYGKRVLIQINKRPVLTYEGIRVAWGYVWYDRKSLIAKTVSIRGTKTKLLVLSGPSHPNSPNWG